MGGGRCIQCLMDTVDFAEGYYIRASELPVRPALGIDFMLVLLPMRIRPGRPNERAALENLQFRASTESQVYRDAILQHPDSISLASELLSEGRVRVAEANDSPTTFGLEGTGHYGRAFTQALVRQGFTVFEVPGVLTKRHRGQGSRKGKSDRNDAHAIAEAVLRESERLPLFREHDQQEALKAQYDQRDRLVRERSAAINRIRSSDLLVSQSHAAGLRPPSGAPNVLIVLIDDAGFGASSTFGGPCNSPTAERLAKNGLRYTRFHATALCSPTRAALLSGRNHHTVGMGGITEIATSAPGYNSLRPNSMAPLPEMLRLNGYSSAQFGKCHEVPVWEASPVGPFDHWPTGSGFEYFYGFVAGETNQWYPAIHEGTKLVEPPKTPEEGLSLHGGYDRSRIRYASKMSQTSAPGRPVSEAWKSL